MADINIQLEGLSGGDSSSSQYLKSTLDKLNAAIDKLNGSVDRLSMGKGGSNVPGSPSQPDSPQNNQAWQQIGNKIGSVLAAAIGVSVTAGIARYFNNQANAIMGRATATGAFGVAGINGTANSAFGTYASSLFSVERARQIGNNNAVYESLYGLGGSVAGGAIGLLASAENPLLASKLIGGGAAGGGVIGAAYGKEMAALRNAPIEVQMQIAGAKAKRRADASVSEWQTSFSRWGLGTSSYNVVPAALNDGIAINTQLNKDFENKYQGSQNYNAILNGIVPYINRSPMDPKNGDLDQVAQKFLKAGISVQDFGKATMQATQYQAINSKLLGSAADDYQKAIAKFGKGYDLNTNAAALNLMAMGYSTENAQRIAYNSQYNSGMSNNINAYMNSSVQEYYARQSLTKTLGFDPNQSLRLGKMVDSKGKPLSATQLKKLQTIRDNFAAGKGTYPSEFIYSQAAGISPVQFSSLLQASQPENDTNGHAGLGGDQSTAQQISSKLNSPGNVDNMMVNATNVTIMSSFMDIGKSLLGGTTAKSAQNVMNSVGSHLLGFSPSQFGTNHSPSTK